MSVTSPQKLLKTAFILPVLTAGGAERVLITLMNTLDRARFNPVFVTVSTKGPMRDIIDQNIPFHSLEGRKVSLSLPRLYFKLKELKPDIVVSTMAHMNFCVLLLKPFFPKTRFIVREAVTPSFILNTRSHLSFLIKKAYRLLYPRADIVISPAQAIINEFRDLLDMSCENHVLLLNPVDMNRIRAAEDESFEVTKKRKHTVHFISAGRLHSQKGFDRLVKALPEMKRSYDWQWTILGEGSERQALKILIEEHELTDQISLSGFSSNPWPHYAAADCFLMPSRWEGLPNVLLESLACGTPVIATRESGGVEEIAKRAPKNAVTIVDDMAAFLKAMETVKPNPVEIFRPSLLPKDFYKETVVTQFSHILNEAFEPIKNG